MANSTASISIKPTVAFNRGDTFVFGSWVCTADGAGSFQSRLTMDPNPSTGLVTFPKVITGDLTGRFDEISLYNQHADFDFGSASNSNSTSSWAITCESAIEPSCAEFPLHEHFPYGLCNASRAHAKALTTRRPGKEIASDCTSDSNTASGYYSDSSYEFDFESDPEPESENSTIEQPLSGPATGLVITSTPAGRFDYWPNCKPADLTVLTLRRLPRLTFLLGGNTTKLQQKSTLQQRWQLPTPVSAPLIAKSSWLPARRQDP
jgi:hypothetical protein